MLSNPADLVSVGPKLHMVGAPFDDPDDPANMAIAVITQRQSFDQPHTEEYRFLCEQCGRRLFVERFDATPPPREGEVSPASPFTTVIEGARAAQRFNADEGTRRCEHCGQQNAAFPIDEWGWETYAGQSRAADSAKAEMQSMQMAAAGAPAAEEATSTDAKR